MRRRVLTALAIITVVVAFAVWFFTINTTFWHPGEETFWDLLHNKAHWYLEMFVTLLETIFIDLVIGVVVWKLLLKPYIHERQNKVIAEEHERHGIEDHDHDLHEEIVHSTLGGD